MTRYSVEFKTNELIKLGVEKIEEMPGIEPVHIKVSKRKLAITESGVEGGQITRADMAAVGQGYDLPDLLAFLQKETKLTRKTLVKIIKRSGRISEFKDNPAMFMAEVAKCINRAMQELIIDGIKYEPLTGQNYDMRLFAQKEIQSYLDRLYKVKNAGTKSPYDFIEYESKVEKTFAEFFDANEKVKFFCKLPSWFKVETPLGSYNPDWAVVIENDEKLYLVRETKSTRESEKRRGIENDKLNCGKEHFKALNVDFEVATDIYDIFSK